MGKRGRRGRPGLCGGQGLWVGLRDLVLRLSACNLAGLAETAVNIGFACQLLSENMLILEDKDIK